MFVTTIRTRRKSAKRILRELEFYLLFADDNNKFILSEAELARKGEADDYSNYVMSVRKHTNSIEFIKIL